jgi:hypothetical protein
VAKVFSELLIAASVLCLICAGILAFTIRSLDVSILDVYFVIAPRDLILLGTGLLVVAFVMWKTVVVH